MQISSCRFRVISDGLHSQSCSHTHSFHECTYVTDVVSIVIQTSANPRTPISEQD